MRLDGETPFHHSGPVELPSKLSGHDGSHLMINMTNVDNACVREGNHDLTLNMEGKSFKESQNFHRPGNGDVRDMENNDDMEASFSIPTAESGNFEEVIDSCTDKKITESEMMTSYRDGACHVVKDICIDEGIHSVQKILIENTELNHKNSCSLSRSTINGDHDLAKEITNYTVMVSQCMVSSLAAEDKSIHIADKDTEGQVSIDTFVEDGMKTDIADKIEGSISVEKSTLKQLIPLEEHAIDSLQKDTSRFDSSNYQKQSVDQDMINQDELEEKSTATAESSSDEKLAKDGGGKEHSADGEVESGVVVFNFNSREAATSGRQECRETIDVKLAPENIKGPRLEVQSNDGETGSSRRSFVHYNHGDPSLFAPASLSGPLNSSGRIPYSGSISLRSDSSTTSVRSFAFPVLQQEWNSSPVKMAKADRRRLRRLRGWKIKLLCCRF